MFLKKELFHISFSKRKKFSVEYEDIKDLKFGVINLCELLKKDIFLIRIFVNDSLNEKFKSECKKVLNCKNFNIYLIQNIKIIESIDFENLRFLDIYAIENQFITNDFEEMVKSCSFNLGLDNYLDYAKLSVDFNQYDDFIILQLQIK